jgi:ATPase subunit of ABC transporter with duplicated ATPase domains
MLTLQNINFSIAGRQILDGVNLQISGRQRVGLVGRNGSGKSDSIQDYSERIGSGRR